MKRLLMLNLCLVLTLTICKAQKMTVSTDKSYPNEVKSKSLTTTEYNTINNENPVFSNQTFNRIIENQLKQDGLLGQSEKLIKFQLTNTVLTVNTKEAETKFKDKYLNLYFSFMRKPTCQGCFVSYIID